ncbi:putative serine/arginine-rich splicing factor 11 [Toxoplasma gondii GT1]|uniref:Putative serine/arginine-rich splicing factor 11 n=1 Tax=Toxoplasma gondii (strain ATCC 50853 / GT1) TaxID=507601 RepID=S7WDS3_TOXGG|nr:putative serine/arginine-rich splicing factor 11 [Toxoplasma gondii GT1]
MARQELSSRLPRSSYLPVLHRERHSDSAGKAGDRKLTRAPKRRWRFARHRETKGRTRREFLSDVERETSPRPPRSWAVSKRHKPVAGDRRDTRSAAATCPHSACLHASASRPRFPKSGRRSTLGRERKRRGLKTQQRHRMAKRNERESHNRGRHVPKNADRS